VTTESILNVKMWSLLTLSFLVIASEARIREHRSVQSLTAINTTQIHLKVMDPAFRMERNVTTTIVGSVATVPLMRTVRNVVDNVEQVVASVIWTAHAPYAATTPIGRMTIPMNVDVWKMAQNASPEKTATIAVTEHMTTMGTLVEVPAWKMARNAHSGRIVTSAAIMGSIGIQLVNLLVVQSLA
jgi:hypothetical protein